MAKPMAHPEQKHFDQVLGMNGKYQAQTQAISDSVNVIIYIETDRDRAHCATSGLSRLPVRALHPSELECTVHADQVGAAIFLLKSVVQIATQQSAQLTLGSFIGNATPLLAGTDICGVLFTTALRFEELDLVKDKNGDISLHVLTVLPLTSSELAFVEKNGADALEDIIDNTMIDITDVTRGSMVPAKE